MVPTFAINRANDASSLSVLPCRSLSTVDVLKNSIRNISTCSNWTESKIHND